MLGAMRALRWIRLEYRERRRTCRGRERPDSSSTKHLSRDEIVWCGGWLDEEMEGEPTRKFWTNNTNTDNNNDSEEIANKHGRSELEMKIDNS